MCVQSCSSVSSEPAPEERAARGSLPRPVSRRRSMPPAGTTRSVGRKRIGTRIGVSTGASRPSAWRNQPFWIGSRWRSERSPYVATGVPSSCVERLAVGPEDLELGREVGVGLARSSATGRRRAGR